MAAGTLLPPALRKPFTFVTDKRIRQYLLRYGKKGQYNGWHARDIQA